jgi:hypothetical protein
LMAKAAITAMNGVSRAAGSLGRAVRCSAAAVKLF